MSGEIDDRDMNILDNYTEEEILRFLDNKKKKQEKGTIEANIEMDKSFDKIKWIGLGNRFCGMCGRPAEVDIIGTYLRNQERLGTITQYKKELKNGKGGE